MSCLILAYKFNDILYAINTREYQQSDYRVLVTFFDAVPDGVADLFDKIFIFSYKRNIVAMFRNLLACWRATGAAFFRQQGAFIASNYQVLNTRLFFSLLCRHFHGVYIEDGMMSYFLTSISADNSGVEKIPALVQKAAGIDKTALAAKVDVGYFLAPELISWVRDARKLQIQCSIGSARAVSQQVEKFNGKSFFAGQPVYEHFDWYSKKAYIDKINQLYREGCIDWYLSHPHEPADVTAAVECPVFWVNANFQSFESVASLVRNVNVYTFFSSLAYTVPLLTQAQVYLVRDFICNDRYHDERVVRLLQRMGISYQLV